MGIKIVIDTSFDVAAPETFGVRSCIGTCIIESIIPPEISQIDRTRNESVDIILVVLCLSKYTILKDETVIVTVNNIAYAKMLILPFISGQSVIGNVYFATTWVNIILTAEEVNNLICMLILVITGINTGKPVNAPKSLT